MTTIIIVTLFLVSVIGFGMLLKRMRQKGFKTSQNPVQAPPAAKQEPPGVEFTKILDTLLKLNLMIRKDRALSKEMTIGIEQIIDDLKSVIPAMMERYPSETLTYELKKIGSSHLYATVKEFLDLSPDGRQNQLVTFNATIGSLHDVCTRSRQIVDNNETAEFKTMAHFLAGKFS